ncbi:hypothetical protein [Deinococcus yavapaiensis]|uniref:Hydrocarbon binding protein n=1 Tax=Deinococcus yavapaiensis KR-236 TaxID=694435 RepID=A0A318S5D8_9DEIO|nr:hypothetical protein [Deinococcus yavapaiensis]PYE53765.1 hypothetical protein DES52_10723 [Deinococcus yavapaiensis KR-236]
MTATVSTLRPTLGDFSSIVCFKAVITGVEDTLGDDGAAAVFIRAGRVRGHQLAKSLGLSNAELPIEQVASVLNEAIGKSGTRLCAVTKAYRDGEAIVVETQDTLCSAGEPVGGERKCTFTLGAVWGALEEVSGTMLRGVHTESVLRGGSCDKFVFTPF